MDIVRVDNLKGVRVEGPNKDGTYTRTEYENNSRTGYKETVTIVTREEVIRWREV